MSDFQKVQVPVDYPQACICGSPKGPLVATGIAYPVGAGLPGQFYLCRRCVQLSARVLGIAKGEEMERLENAADHLEQAQREVDERQALIESMTVRAADRDRTIETQKGYIEQLQAEASQKKHLAELIATNARELTAA